MVNPPRTRRLGLSQRGQYIVRIQEAIDTKLQREDDDNLKFICEKDLEAVLREHKGTLFSFEQWQPAQSRQVMEQCYHILGTLVVIGALSEVESIRNLFFRRERQYLSSPKLTDAHLLDDPNANHDLLEFLCCLPYALRETFLRVRYVLKPHALAEQNPNQTIRLDARIRLPFQEEESDIGVGGYSDVSKVVVPPYYFLTDRGAIYDKKMVFAIKRVTAYKDFDKEVGNNQILKESMTSHKGILQHHLSFIHGNSFNILLPIAEHGNLEVLLNEGFDPAYQRQRYGIYSEFPNLRIGSDKLFSDIIGQFTSIVEAVGWLHDGIRVKQAANVYLIHMDLKPDNILITDDPKGESSIGTWVLSDFGISVAKQMYHQPERPKYLTVGDAYHQFQSRQNGDKSHTRARRATGTYQAPEVEGNRRAGRRSDVWSLACIYSELIPFGIGGSAFLKSFRDARMQVRRGYQDDNFYSEKPDAGAWQDYNPQNFELRPSVAGWLQSNLPHISDNLRWADRASVVLRTLKVAMEDRPDCRTFQRWVENGKIDQDGDVAGKPGPEPIQPETASSSTPMTWTDSHTTSTGPPPYPANNPESTRRDSVKKKENLSAPNAGGSFNSPQELSTENEVRPYEEAPLTYLPWTSPPSNAVSPSTPDSPSSSRRKASDSRSDNNTLSYGLGPLLKQVSSEHQVMRFEDPKSTASNISICCSGGRALWLVNSSTQPLMRLISRDSRSGKFSSDLENPEIPLSSSVEWKQVEICGDYAGAFGGFKGRTNMKTVCLYDLRRPDRAIPIPGEAHLSQVDNISVSGSGIGVLRGRRKLILVELEVTGPMVRGELSPKDGFKFNHVCFSPFGELLLAWCYGKGRDLAIYCWHFDSNRDYTETVYRLRPLVKVGPEITHMFVLPSQAITPSIDIVFGCGCAFHTAHLEMGEAVITSSIDLGAVWLAEVFADKYLITLRPSTIRKRYKLLAHAIPFNKSEKENKIDEFPSDSKPWKMRVISNNEVVMIYILMLNGKVRSVELSQSRDNSAGAVG